MKGISDSGSYHMTILAAWLPTRHIPKKLLGRRCPFVQQLRSYFAIELNLDELYTYSHALEWIDVCKLPEA